MVADTRVDGPLVAVAVTRSLVLVLAVGTSGCGVLTHARPTPAGKLALEAAAGGPMASLGGVPVPLPLATVGASYGLAERWDVAAHVHLTPLLMFRTAGFDLGATYLLLDQRGAVPALALSSRAYAFTDFRSAVLPYVDLSGTASWQLGRVFLGYATLTAMLPYDARFTLSPAVGATAELGRFTVQLELRWYDPTYDTGPAIAPWLSPGGHGALGLILGGAFRL